MAGDTNPQRPLPAAWLVGAMYIAYFLNFCARQAVFSTYPLLKAELGFTDAQLGLIGSVFGFAYGLSSPFAGEAADRFSQRGLVVLSIVFWSLMTAATGLSTSIFMLLGTRALVGVSESFYMPSAIALTGGAYPPSARSRAIGFLKTAQIFGVIAGASFAGVMADAGHWRGAFFALGALGVLYALPCRICLNRCASAVHAETRPSGSLVRTFAVVRIPSFMLLGLAFGVYSFGLWLAYAWLPAFFHEKFSMSLGRAGFASTACLQGSGFAAMIGGAWLADRAYRRFAWARFAAVVAGLAMAAPCFHLVGHCASLAGTESAAAGLGLGVGIVTANAFTAAFDVIPADTRGASVGILNLFAAPGGAMGPFLGGRLKASLGLEGALSIAGAAYAAAAIVLLAGILLWFRRDYGRSRVF